MGLNYFVICPFKHGSCQKAAVCGGSINSKKILRCRMRSSGLMKSSKHQQSQEWLHQQKGSHRMGKEIIHNNGFLEIRVRLRFPSKAELRSDNGVGKVITFCTSIPFGESCIISRLNRAASKRSCVTKIQAMPCCSIFPLTSRLKYHVNRDPNQQKVRPIG